MAATELPCLALDSIELLQLIDKQDFAAPVVANTLCSSGYIRKRWTELAGKGEEIVFESATDTDAPAASSTSPIRLFTHQLGAARLTDNET